MKHLSRLAVLPLALATACTDPADRAAKERIFSPEEPVPALARARESIDAANAATDPTTWRRVWTMDREELTRRIGAHRSSSEVKWRWTRPGRAVALTETHTFETDADGDFHATITNDEESGLEFVWVDGQAFARSRFGQFRARRIDRAQHDVWRNQATSAPRVLFELFNRRLRGSVAGTETYEGRAVVRYTLVLGDAFGDAPPATEALPVAFGRYRDEEGKLVPGPDPDTGRRLEFERRRTPERIAGEALVDRQTGTIVKLEAKARFQVPGAEEGEAATLDLEVAYALLPDPSVKIAPPKDVTAPKMPHAVRNPLGFLGDQAPAAAAAAEPADEDDSP